VLTILKKLWDSNLNKTFNNIYIVMIKPERILDVNENEYTNKM